MANTGGRTAGGVNHDIELRMRDQGFGIILNQRGAVTQSVVPRRCTMHFILPAHPLQRLFGAGR